MKKLNKTGLSTDPWGTPLVAGLNHRIIKWFGWEGIFEGHLVQPTCEDQGHLQLDQVAQSPIQPNLECSRVWGTDHLSGQPVPEFHHPHRKKFLPYIQAESPLF